MSVVKASSRMCMRPLQKQHVHRPVKVMESRQSATAQAAMSPNRQDLWQRSPESAPCIIYSDGLLSDLGWIFVTDTCP